jgi:hypothetical protein
VAAALDFWPNVRSAARKGGILVTLLSDKAAKASRRPTCDFADFSRLKRRKKFWPPPFQAQFGANT